MAKILVTGASGFIGRRLVLALLDMGHTVFAHIRIKGTELFSEKKQNLHFVWGDLRDPNALEDLPEDIDAAYYLMHSMSDISKGLLDVERKVAENFVRVMKKTKVQQIIYLGGILDEGKLSLHLESRKLVEDILKKSAIPATVLRASIIIGEGSASFEIIRDLVEKLPVMVAPKWIKSLCQPISIIDVLYYLTNILLLKASYGKTFDIGGPDVLQFKDVLLRYAKIRGLKRLILTVPVLTPRLSSYWLAFVTSVRFSLAQYLVDTMKVHTVCHEQDIQKIIPHTCLSFDEAVRVSSSRESNRTLSTWMDSWEVQHDRPDIATFTRVPRENVYKDRQVVDITGNPEDTLQRIWSIGGSVGWYGYEWAWNLRGLLDKLVGGVGMNRGRRHQTEIVVGDSIDFWRVVKADKENKELILFAEMKVPGKAWLEFKIERRPENTEQLQLIQTATFRPDGMFGRIYWHLMLPFHYLIFKNMAKKIANNGGSFISP